MAEKEIDSGTFPLMVTGFGSQASNHQIQPTQKPLRAFRPADLKRWVQPHMEEIMSALKFVQVTVAVLFSVVITSCASVPDIPISGNTTASPMLRNDTLKMLSVMFETEANCSKIDAVETEVLSGTPDPDSAVYALGKMFGGKPEDSIKERWTAIGCGQRMPLEVIFVPDGKGGTYILQERPK